MMLALTLTLTFCSGMAFAAAIDVWGGASAERLNKAESILAEATRIMDLTEGIAKSAISRNRGVPVAS